MSLAVTRCRGPFAIVAQPGFAGPRTKFRGVGLADGGTYEADQRPRGTPAAVVLDPRAVIVVDENGDEWCFVPSKPGVTLGELIDEAVMQRARIDSALPAHILAQIVDGAFADDAQPVSCDQVLLGFDGAVLWRGHLPWWGARTTPRVESGYAVAPGRATTALLFGRLSAELFSTERVVSKDLTLPHVDRAIRDEARELVVRLLVGPLVPAPGGDTPGPDVGNNTGDVVSVAEIKERLERITARIGAIGREDVADLVQSLFPARVAAEAEARAMVERIAAGN